MPNFLTSLAASTLHQFYPYGRPGWYEQSGDPDPDFPLSNLARETPCRCSVSSRGACGSPQSQREQVSLLPGLTSSEEGRSADAYKMVSSTWASLSLLAETGPASLSHLLGRREQKDPTSRVEYEPSRTGLRPATSIKAEIGGSRSGRTKEGLIDSG